MGRSDVASRNSLLRYSSNQKNDCMLAQQYVDTTSGVAHHRANPEGGRDLGLIDQWILG